MTDKKDLDQNIFVKVRSTGNLLEAKVNLKEGLTNMINWVHEFKKTNICTDWIWKL